MRKVLVTIVLALITAAMAQGQAATEQKQIKDPAEYNAYIAALNTTDPAAKGAAMEAFVKQYPQSIVKSDALDQAMASDEAAARIASTDCQRGLQALPSWNKEQGMSDADFAKMRTQVSGIFNGACG